MKILIIGGTGFIGPFVVKELKEQGHELAIFNRGNNNSIISGHQIAFISGDKHDLYNFRTEFKKFMPEVVIHMGAYSKSDADIVIKTFEGITERIVVLSSIDVYHAYGILIGLEEGITPTPLTETSLLRQKLHPYGGDYEKILVEDLIMNSSDIAGTILRLPMVYGPGDPSNRLYKYAKRIHDNRNVIILDELFANWRGSREYVENVAHAISLAATDNRAKNRIYNVGDLRTQTEYDWLVNIVNTMNWSGKILSFPRNELPEDLIYSVLNLKQNWDIDTTRIRQELNYNEPVPVEEAIRRTIAWEINNPPDALHPKDFPRLDYEIENKFLANF